MNKLTDTQITVLTAAAKRPDGNIEPLPATINAGIRPRVIQGLLSRALACGSEGRYRITPAGFQAVGLTPPLPARTDTKQARMLTLMQRPEGASLDEICAETGWQKHTVRGVFVNTVKKRLGLAITSAKDAEHERRYFLGASQ